MSARHRNDAVQEIWVEYISRLNVALSIVQNSWPGTQRLSQEDTPQEDRERMNELYRRHDALMAEMEGIIKTSRLLKLKDAEAMRL